MRGAKRGRSFYKGQPALDSSESPLMKCPSCAQSLETAAPRCPHCKFSMEKLDDRFGLVPAHSRFLSDRSGTMELADMHRLRDELRLFHRKFPQSLLSVLVTELEPGTSVS